MKNPGRAGACNAAVTTAVAMVAALLLISASRLAALDASLNEKSRLSLHGDTNHGTWQCATSAMTVSIKSGLDRVAFEKAIAALDTMGSGKPAAEPPDWDTPDPPSLHLRVPVAALDCGIRPMERDLRRALRAEQYPDITFELRAVDSLSVVSAGHYRLTVSGALRLAGAEQIVSIRLTAVRMAGDQYRFTADLPLRMTQFGITPPVGLFGLIRSEDALLIHFDLTFTVTG